MGVTSRTLDLAAQAKAHTTATVDAYTYSLIRAWATAWDDIAAEFDRELARMQRLDRYADGEPDSERIRQLQTSMSQVVDHRLAELINETGAQVGSTNRQLANQIVADMAKVLESQVDPSYWPGFVRPVPEATLAWVADRATQQITVRNYFLQQDATRAMKRELMLGVAAGDNPNDAARRMLARVEGEFNGGLVRATVIARTEMLDASRDAALEQRKANDDILEGWIWHADLSSRTCPACWAMHGTMHPVDEPGPDGHHQCLLPGAIVSGPIPTGATARWYDGEVCDIETVDGRTLSVTPNHPILTARGWVPAGLLHEGDDLICGSGTQGVPTGVSPDDHQQPALIEDVAQALLGSPSMFAVSVPTAAEDFHGDGGGSKVHVVATDRELWRGVDTPFAKPVSKPGLFVRDMGHALLATLRDIRDVRIRVGRPARSSLRCCDSCGALLWTPIGLGESVGFGRPSNGDPVRSQDSADHIARNAMLLSNGVLGDAFSVRRNDRRRIDSAFDGCLGAVLGTDHRVPRALGAPESSLTEDTAKTVGTYVVPGSTDLAAFTGDVVTDRVLNLRRRSWSGHVYNLQTRTGWYVANSIVVHNCRCTALPATESAANLGLAGGDVPGTRPTQADAAAKFEALPERVQREILGPARFEAWKSGQYPMSAWAQRVEHYETVNGQRIQAWRDSIHASPAPAMPAGGWKWTVPPEGRRLTPAEAAHFAARQAATPFEFHGATLTPREVQFAERMHARGEVIEWIARADRVPGQGLLKQNDFIWISRDGREWELKSPKAKYGTIKRAISADADAKNRFVVDLGAAALPPKLRRDLALYNVRTEGAAIFELVILASDGRDLTRITLA